MFIDIDKTLDFAIENNFNVLLSGRHGVGKTSRMREAFERNGIKYHYYSAPTMDPWVDLVGIPKPTEDKDYGEVLQLVRPRQILDESFSAIILDEYNRAPKKVRNAVMELIQFKTINGYCLDHIKYIWVGVNPSDDHSLTYDVDELDPAQKDRFHIQIDVPYTIDEDYFVGRFGRTWTRAAQEWWNSLPDKVKEVVCPRRVETALQIASKGGDLRSCLPIQSNPHSLGRKLKQGAVSDKLQEIYDQQDETAAAKYIGNMNNFKAALPYLQKNEKLMGFYLPHAHPESIVAAMAEHMDVRTFVVVKSPQHEVFAEIIRDVIKADGDDATAANLESLLKTNNCKLYDEVVALRYEKIVDGRTDKPQRLWSEISRSFREAKQTNTMQRLRLMQLLDDSVPLSLQREGLTVFSKMCDYISRTTPNVLGRTPSVAKNLNSLIFALRDGYEINEPGGVIRTILAKSRVSKVRWDAVVSKLGSRVVDDTYWKIKQPAMSVTS